MHFNYRHDNRNMIIVQTDGLSLDLAGTILSESNALAYWTGALITVQKRFIADVPVPSSCHRRHKNPGRPLGCRRRCNAA
jgi:hypothetical protein